MALRLFITLRLFNPLRLFITLRLFMSTMFVIDGPRLRYSLRC
jgi:hypothetical protein